jgi:hypothetical protein
VSHFPLHTLSFILDVQEVLTTGDVPFVGGAAHRKSVSAAGLSEGARLFSLGESLGLFEGSEVSRLSLG